MAIAARLVAGVDVWLNTPRRPWEACGTSGMKVLANGGLNLSELDGWWAEAYEPDFGWALGGTGNPDDARDAERLYALLEREIIPEFYTRDEQGLPRRWLERIRASMSRLAPAFSSTRMLFEYLHHWYVPAIHAMRERTAHGGMLAKHLAAWERDLELHWDRTRVFSKAVNRSGRHLEFVADVRLDGLATEAVRVELYAEQQGAAPAFCEPMQRTSPAAAGDPLSFSLTVATERPASDFTPRVVAQHSSAQLPAECSLIAWANASFEDVH